MVPRDPPNIRRSIWLFVIAAVGFVGILFAFVDVIPPRGMTLSSMAETSVRIELYFGRNKKLPPDLGVLPVRNGYMNRTTDGWNRDLTYTIGAPDAFSLSSLGRDGKPGGNGEDADISQRYRVMNGEIQPVP